MELGELVVYFERDAQPRRYPYLGQVCLLGHVLDLLEGYNCKRPVEFSPRYATPEADLRMNAILTGTGSAPQKLEEFAAWSPPMKWFLPEEGWKTARCIQAALASGRASSAGVMYIIGGLTAEADDLVAVMERAVAADIRFSVDMEECATAPVDLVQFVENDFADTVALVREALEENGIEITEEPQ